MEHELYNLRNRLLSIRNELIELIEHVEKLQVNCNNGEFE